MNSQIHFFPSVDDLSKDLPPAHEELMPGVKWGDFREMYTPAFWKVQYRLSQFPQTPNNHRFATEIHHEIVACLLGGYGLPSEIGLLAFRRLRERNLIRTGIDHDALNQSLREPFLLESGKQITYRFYNQKSKFIHRFLNRQDLNSIPIHDDLQLREWLLSIDGIGPKTASWITRNWLQSENVAIIDIHLHRAGVIAGFFDRNSNVSTEYYNLENSYISFCNALQVLPSNLDALIWDNMKRTNRIALQVLDSFIS